MALLLYVQCHITINKVFSALLIQTFPLLKIVDGPDLTRGAYTNINLIYNAFPIRKCCDWCNKGRSMSYAVWDDAHKRTLPAK